VGPTAFPSHPTGFRNSESGPNQRPPPTPNPVQRLPSANRRSKSPPRSPPRQLQSPPLAAIRVTNSWFPPSLLKCACFRWKKLFLISSSGIPRARHHCLTLGKNLLHISHQLGERRRPVHHEDYPQGHQQKDNRVNLL